MDMTEDQQSTQNTNQQAPQGGPGLDDNLKEFVEALVLAITGFHIEDIPEDKREEIVKDCVEFFTGYIINYVGEKYDKKDSIRLKVGYETGENVFEKYPDLEAKYDEAYQSFVKMLEENLKREEEELKKQQTEEQTNPEPVENTPENQEQSSAPGQPQEQQPPYPQA